MSTSTLTRPTVPVTPARRALRTTGTYTGTRCGVGSYAGSASVVGSYTGTHSPAVGRYVSAQR